jgi:aryl-alcohol dehydrogenase-like predicted oxidoreductase
MKLNNLGSTTIRVSPLGLGTVKFGRNQQVKYPTTFALPTDNEIRNLLELAMELGINVLDTAPAYGNSMERLGKLLPGNRNNWVIVSKVGEFFEQGQSRFDFSYNTTISVVEHSLRTLNTDYLDIVLIHSNGNDTHILQHEPVIEALHKLKQRGLIRAHGLSSKTVNGGLLAIQELDVIMLTLNPYYTNELPVIAAANKLNKGVLIKKGLNSGHISNQDHIKTSMQFIVSQSGVHSLIIGTINAQHLRFNAEIMKAIIHEKNL